MVTSEWYDHRDVDSVVGLAAGGTPVANLKFGPVKEGQIWYIERLNTHIPGTHTAIVKAYVTTGDGPDPLDAQRQDVSAGTDLAPAAVQDYGREFVSPIIVPPGYNLIINFTGGTLAAGDQAVASIQRAWCATNPGSAYGALSARERQSLAEEEQVEDIRRHTTAVVGASGWNMGLVDSEDGLAASAHSPWASRDPRDAADNPAQPVLGEGMGQYVGENALGPQHPRPPYDGRILPDGTVDRVDGG